MRTKRLAIFGLWLAGVTAAGAFAAQATQLSNITVERSQDFTTVTLHGDAAMNVTHQIVEAKDGKPHRIVVDLMGVEHQLSKNNFRDLPNGTIRGIRTSQFAVSPEPVVRVVLDLQKPAAYRLKTPGDQVQIMVSLPGDPPMARVWAAQETAVLATHEAAEAPTQSDKAVVATAAPKMMPKSEEKPKTVVASRSAATPTVQADPKIAKTTQKATRQPVTARKAPAPKTAAEPKATAPARTPARAKPAVTKPAAPKAEPAARQDKPVYATADDPEAPQVPLPQPRIRTEQSIDYNVPVPAPSAVLKSQPAGPKRARTEPVSPERKASQGLAQQGTESATRKVASVQGGVGVTPTTPAVEQNQEPSTPLGTKSLEPAGGSKPVASLTTLPPLPETTPQLIPPRSRVMYHSQGRRDPFKPLVQTGKSYNAAALPEIGSLRLVGLLHDVDQSWGLFEDANGFGYILKKGDRVKNGRLTKLTETRAYFQLSEFGWSRSVQLDLEPEG
jgi:hypothetical protein